MKRNEVVASSGKVWGVVGGLMEEDVRLAGGTADTYWNWTASDYKAMSVSYCIL
jgi:hypothetical protein